MVVPYRLMVCLTSKKREEGEATTDQRHDDCGIMNSGTKPPPRRSKHSIFILVVFILVGVALRGSDKLWLSGEPIQVAATVKAQNIAVRLDDGGETSQSLRDDDPFDPPPWIRNYIEFHNGRVQANNQLASGTKILQYQCLHSVNGTKWSCGGLGDRIKGILTGFLSSVNDHRVFLIRWDDITPLSDYLQPAHVNWLAQYDKAIEHSSTSETVRIRGDPHHPLTTNPCELRSNATMIKYSNIYLSSQKKMNTSCEESFFPGGQVTDKRMWHTIFNTLFQLSNRTREAAQRLLGPVDPNYFVAAHIRTGGNQSSFLDPFRHSTSNDLQLFSQCTEMVRSELAAKCGAIPAVYVASDNDDAKDYMMTRGVDVHAAPVEIYHIDRSDASLIENMTLATDAVWGEFKILMDATCLIVGKSGFSLLGQHMSRHQPQPRCAVRFDMCTPQAVKLTVQENARC